MSTAIAELEAGLPPGTVLTDPAEMQAFRNDRSHDPGAGMPLAVVRATSSEHVQTAVRVAARHGLAVVTRGAGSGLSGGASAVEGGLVIALDRMDGIRIDTRNRVAIAEPGALNAAVKAAARAEGLWYPPDPSSYEFCSIGGNVATNAGGLCCVKYGVTSDYVLGLTAVLADGSLVRLGGPRIKDTAGLALTKLFVGSEGTLGVITEVVLRLIPPQPRPTTIIASFAELDGATRTVVDITARLRPAMLEFLDDTCINAVEDVLGMGLNRSLAALLVIQSDEPGGQADDDARVIAEICRSHGALEVRITADPVESEAFVEARRQAIPAVERRGAVLLEDVGVPIPRLGDLVLGVRAIAERNGVVIAVLAHAGDGNTHPLVVYDADDAHQAGRAARAYDEVMELAIALDGTITGEHGVGRLKRPWLTANIGEEAVSLNRRVKAALDPDGILNPGAVY